MAQLWIDAHGHFAAPGLALPRGGAEMEAGGAWVFTVETSLADMDRTGVATPHGVTADEMRAAFARFYYDTALAVTAHSLDPILDVTTPDHVIYGADFGAPSTDPPLCDFNLVATRGYERLTLAQREAIGSNVLTLFPSFSQRIGARDRIAVAAE